MRTVKVENSYYDKVKQLSDASGETMVATFNGIVAAGLGELKGLGDVLKASDRKIGNPLESLDSGEEVEEEVEEEEEGLGSGWLWVGAAVLGILALRYRATQAQLR